MREYLMFRLYGPMASWGDIAVGEYRPSFAHPSKSAVMGMLAAAVGLRREEEDKIAAICRFIRLCGTGSCRRNAIARLPYNTGAAETKGCKACYTSFRAFGPQIEHHPFKSRLSLRCLLYHCNLGFRRTSSLQSC